jgi:hypothetical protein
LNEWTCRGGPATRSASCHSVYPGQLARRIGPAPGASACSRGWPDGEHAEPHVPPPRCMQTEPTTRPLTRATAICRVRVSQPNLLSSSPACATGHISPSVAAYASLITSATAVVSRMSSAAAEDCRAISSGRAVVKSFPLQRQTSRSAPPPGLGLGRQYRWLTSLC